MDASVRVDPPEGADLVGGAEGPTLLPLRGFFARSFVGCAQKGVVSAVLLARGARTARTCAQKERRRKGECRLSCGSDGQQQRSWDRDEANGRAAVLPKGTHMAERLPRRGHPRLPPLLHQPPADRARARAEPEFVHLRWRCGQRGRRRGLLACLRRLDVRDYCLGRAEPSLKVWIRNR